MFDKPPGYRDLYGVGLSMIDFCRCLYKDIHDNLDEWVHWALHDLEEYDDPEDAELQRNAIDERRKDLENKLNVLDELIKEKEIWWTPHHAVF